MNDLERSTSADTSAARYPAPRDLARWGNLGLVVGLAGVALLAVGYFTADGEHFFRSYLVGWLYWLTIALGSLALLMVHHLTTGAWGTVARRIFEAAVRTLPYLAVLFVPIYLGLGTLYEWTHEPLHGNKAIWLTPSNWLLRSVIYLAVWVVLAWVLTHFSAKQDEADAAGATVLYKKMRVVAGGGLVFFAFALTFASFDWIMSLDPHWYSTIYGAWFFGGSGLGALGLLVLMGLFLSNREPMDGVIAKHHFHDWGKLLLAFTMLWAYFSLSQLLIIWSGNIPEEVLWYHDRLRGGWGGVGLALALLHFALPFLLLLSRDLKRQSKMLAGVAILLLVMHWVDLYWNVVPNFTPENLSFHWLDVVAPLALGGLWVWIFVRQLRKRPLLPINDPYLEEVFTDGGH